MTVYQCAEEGSDIINPVDNFGTVVGENPDFLLLSGTVVGENPDHVCWEHMELCICSSISPLNLQHILTDDPRQ